MNIKHIQLLVRTAALGSISAAAEEIGLSSSLASRNLAALESELGALLLHRTTRSLQVTEAGALVVRWGQSSLSNYSAMLDELHALQGRPAGLVRIACTEFLAVHIVADVLAEFSRLYPDIKVSISTTDKVVDLHEGQFDVAIHVGQAPDSNLLVRRVREVRTRLCASPQYLATHGMPQHPADLAGHRCLAHATYEPRNWFFKKGDDLITQAVEPLVMTTNTSMLRQLALNGVGIARVSLRMLKGDLENGSLVSVLPDYEPTQSNGEHPCVWAIYPDSQMLIRTRLLMTAIIDHMGRDS